MSKLTLTPQECFDISTRGIIAQGGPARAGDGSCMYRAPDGRKCAAGQLLPDELYYLGMEGVPVGPIAFFADHRDLVRALQRAHDFTSGNFPFWPAWKGLLEDVAKRHNLDPAVLSEIPT